MQLIVVCRFFPGGRTAVTLCCGIVGYSRRRFVVATAASGLIWASYSFFIGRLGGRAFQDAPWAGFAVAFGVTVALSGLVELIRRIMSRRRGTATSGRGHAGPAEADDPGEQPPERPGEEAEKRVLHRFTTPATTPLHAPAVKWGRIRAGGGHDAKHLHSVIFRPGGCPAFALVVVTSRATGTPAASGRPGRGAGSPPWSHDTPPPLRLPPPPRLRPAACNRVVRSAATKRIVINTLRSQLAAVALGRRGLAWSRGDPGRLQGRNLRRKNFAMNCRESGVAPRLKTDKT